MIRRVKSLQGDWEYLEAPHCTYSTNGWHLLNKTRGMEQTGHLNKGDTGHLNKGDMSGRRLCGFAKGKSYFT